MVGSILNVYVVFLAEALMISVVHPVISLEQIFLTVIVHNTTHCSEWVELAIGTDEVLTLWHVVNTVLQTIATINEVFVCPNVSLISRHALGIHSIVLQTLEVSLIVESWVVDSLITTS